MLVKEYQLDPVTHQLLHADFYRIAMDRVLRVTVPVIVKGEATGVKQQGGILEFVHREIEIECLPADIPEHIEVDVSELMLHQGIRVRDVPANPKWKPVDRRRHDARARHHAEGRRSAGAGRGRGGGGGRATAPAEPEVIKKGKKDEDEDEGRQEEVAGVNAPMKAIVGLGNPGPKYRGTRHNVGFAVIDELAQRGGGEFRGGAGRRADRGGGASATAETSCCSPSRMTFMNASGEAVGGLLRYFKIDAADLLVVVDEVQLPLGEAAGAGAGIGRRAQRAEVDHRARRRRVSAAADGRRTRRRRRAQRDLADHVLARFEPDEARGGRAHDRARGGCGGDVRRGGIAAVMNRFNGGDPATTE